MFSKRNFTTSWEICLSFSVSRMHKTVLESSRKVLVIEDPRGLIYKSLSLSLSSDLKFLSLSLDHKVLETFQGLRILQTVHYVWSCDVHKFCYRPPPCMKIRWRMSYLPMSDITYRYMSASKPFFTVTQCCCARWKSLSLSSSHKSLNPILAQKLMFLSHVFDGSRTLHVTHSDATACLTRLRTHFVSSEETLHSPWSRVDSVP